MKVTDLKQLGQQAKEASYTPGLMDTRQKYFVKQNGRSH